MHSLKDYLKVVIATTAIVTARLETTGFETEYPSRKGKDHYDPTFLGGTYYRAQHEHRA